MRIDLINDNHVLVVVGKRRSGEPTFYIRSILLHLYPKLDAPSMLRKLKDMEKRGLIRRIKSEHFKHSITWTH